ncbi:MAG: acyltransferase family protein [Oscillospiraceae bacterium]
MDSKSKNVRNGKIELYRFIFCIGILLFHAAKYIIGEPSFKNGIHISLFSHGAMGCEFFFVVSGYLMAKSIYKKLNSNPVENDKPRATQYLSFIKKKYTDIFPEHSVAFIIAIICFSISEGYNIIKFLKYSIDCIPGFFLIQMTGIKFSNPNHVEWYISCMLIAMSIIYPICYRWYYRFTRYFSWLGAILILGYMIYTGDGLTGVSVWTGVCFRSLLRAIAEISLGASAFELSRYISKKQWSKYQRVMLTLTELFCFIGTMIYMIMTFPKKYDIYALAFIFVIVTVAFSQVTYGSHLFNNRVCYFLGKLSLPVYLGQLSAIYIVNGFFSSYSHTHMILLVVLLSFAFAAVIYAGGKALRNIVNKLKVSN